MSRSGRVPLTVFVIGDLSNRTGKPPNPWEWEIRRRSKPIMVNVSGSGLRSRGGAEFAGKRELAEFLKLLPEEEKAPFVATHNFPVFHTRNGVRSRQGPVD